MSYKTINSLMKHLRNNGIDISGSRHKRHLVNTGYFHGYKGYRFFNDTSNKLQYVSYSEVINTIEYDMKIKSLFYNKIMQIETAIKNITIESILNDAKSENLGDIFKKSISSYSNCPANTNTDKRKKCEKEKLILQHKIHGIISKEYNKQNPKITHYYDGYTGKSNGIPIWAVIEVMMLGDFGYFMQCLSYSVRDDISKKLTIPVNIDTYRNLIYKYIYVLKDLRNAVAHNDVLFDARFCKSRPNRGMRSFLKARYSLSYFNLKTIGDFVILIVYYMQALGFQKTEIKQFINDFEKYTTDYKKTVNSNVSSVVIHPDLYARLKQVKSFI